VVRHVSQRPAVRGMLVRAAYLIARHRSDPRLAPALIGLEARRRALEALSAFEAKVALLEVRALSPEAEGEARAERARVEARIRAEARALSASIERFELRRAALAEEWDLRISSERTRTPMIRTR